MKTSIDIADALIEAAKKFCWPSQVRIAATLRALLHAVGELWTADRDFNRFPQLKTRNPLVA